MTSNVKYFAPMLLVLAACSKPMTVEVINDLDIDRDGEIIELDASAVTSRTGKQFVITDKNGTEIPYQLTHDNKIIFPVSIAACDTAVYTITEGIPADVEVTATGRQYPERLDDIAWENDKAAYRVYGPAIQARGDKLYGYDVFTKSVDYPVVEERYRMECDENAWKRINAIRAEGRHAEADSLVDIISYHVDHGNGMDVYAVGPTLGGGASALLHEGEPVYPYAYRDYEILDNGPLRFTLKLGFAPTAVGSDSVIETRIITLDKGSHLNRTVINYSGLSASTDIASGIVVHRQNPDGYTLDSDHGFVAYADSTENASAGNGVIYVGLVVPHAVSTDMSMKPLPSPAGDAIGHVMATSSYTPDSDYIYYWGSGWSKGGVADYDAWTGYLADYSMRVNTPLRVSLK